MTPEQFENAERLRKQINNHKGILNLLKGDVPVSDTRCRQVELKSCGLIYALPERLIHEFIHATQHSLNKLETEFNEL
jgi:hypothetical protein